MGIFNKLFGGVDKNALIKELVRLRIRSDPQASAMGFNENMVDGIPDFQLAGLPEATIVTIVETWAILHKRGVLDAEIFARIEEHRSRTFPRGEMPVPLNLLTYAKYRLNIEHSHGAQMSRLSLAAAVEVAKKAYTA